MLAYILLLSLVAESAIATTEWFGDLRAQLNPPRLPAFYDVTYDDTECPQGMQSNAIPDYVYFGAMLATHTVKEHSECLQNCIIDKKCVAVNFFEAMSYQEDGFCELLSETQFDNPRLMRPFRKATYYEKIRCRTDEDVEAAVDESAFGVLEGSGQEDDLDTTNSTKRPDLPTRPSLPSRVPEARQNWNEDKTLVNQLVKEKAVAMLMKRIEQKVHEFNMRFRS